MGLLHLIKPGTCIEKEDREQALKIERVISQLEDCFNEAQLSLILFDKEMAEVHSVTSSREEWFKRKEKREKIRASIEHEFDLTVLKNYKELEKKIDLILYEEQLSNGEYPNFLKIKLPFIYAKSFLYSFDTIEKLIKILSRDDLAKQEISAIKTMMKVKFPDLTNLRDSFHHFEDRAIGEKKGSEINLKPIDADGINATGGVIVLGNLAGSSFGCTLGDGRFGKIDVTWESLSTVHEIIQKVIDSLPWKVHERPSL